MADDCRVPVGQARHCPTGADGSSKEQQQMPCDTGMHLLS